VKRSHGGELVWNVITSLKKSLAYAAENEGGGDRLGPWKGRKTDKTFVPFALPVLITEEK